MTALVIDDQTITDIRKKHAIDDVADLRRVIEESSSIYEQWAILPLRRAHLNDLESFSKAANKLLEKWNKMPEQSRNLYLSLAEFRGIKPAPETIDSDRPPYGKLDTSSANKHVQDVILELIHIADDAEVNFCLLGKESNTKLRKTIEHLESFWNAHQEKRATGGRYGSRFTNFAQSVMAVIDVTEVDKVDVMYQVIQRKRR